MKSNDNVSFHFLIKDIKKKPIDIEVPIFNDYSKMFKYLEENIWNNYVAFQIKK